MRSIAVYHASPDKTPPHVLANSYNKARPGFHAGSLTAALDRASFMTHEHAETYNQGFTRDGEDIGDEHDGPDNTKYMHTYSVPRRVTSLVMYEDPHEEGYSNMGTIPEDYDADMQVPEGSTTRVFKYRNRWEDPGSTSYVIPHQLVTSGRVKHLNTRQFNTPDSAHYNDQGGFHAEAKKELGL